MQAATVSSTSVPVSAPLQKSNRAPIRLTYSLIPRNSRCPSSKSFGAIPTRGARVAVNFDFPGLTQAGAVASDPPGCSSPNGPERINRWGKLAGAERLARRHERRHSYRSWLDETGAPLTVQKELIRHASIQTTMNIYGKAMTDSKRQAHSKVVEMVLNSSKSKETVGRNNPVAAIGS